ncbi:MAG: ABC transporter ATP-binding protein [Alphaproteobacteria bacterium]|nr:ABC transporter ATP-binding protein [Alphaproteobacteria bacterium]
MAEQPTSSAKLLVRLFRSYLRPHLGAFILAVCFMAVSAAMTGAMAKLMEPIINQVFQARDYEQLQLVAAAVFTVFFLRGVATYGHSLLMNKIGQRIVTDVQRQLYEHILTLDLAFFHSNASGALTTRFISDVAIMRTATAECLTSAFRGSLTLAVLVGVMFYQDWHLAIGAFLVFPPTAMFVARLGKKMRRVAGNTQAQLGQFAALLGQTFQGIRHVKAYGMEEHEQASAATMTENIYRLSLKGFRIAALSQPVTEALSGIAIVAVILYGGAQVISGQNTPGALFSFITAFLLAYEPMKRLAKMNAQLQSGLAAAERVFTILDMRPSIRDDVAAMPLRSTDYSVALEQVRFAYPDGTMALEDVSLGVPHGKTLAIVGSSGAGKSTIVNLIPRFYDVVSGCIRIGGVDIRALQLADLRAHLALVSQETALFDDTIRANIAYGKRGATDTEIEAAAIAAFADGFIRELPQSYETVVGELGVKLSGGQRQRIAIARAMLRNAPILLLDEATSALDNESERAVQTALRRLQQGRTTIVIAHRLSTIVDADSIAVLQQGRLVEQGTHAELLQRNGPYARLYGQQAFVQGDLTPSPLELHHASRQGA